MFVRLIKETNTNEQAYSGKIKERTGTVPERSVSVRQIPYIPECLYTAARREKMILENSLVHFGRIWYIFFALNLVYSHMCNLAKWCYRKIRTVERNFKTLATQSTCSCIIIRNNNDTVAP